MAHHAPSEIVRLAPDERSAYLLAEARRHDPDRYLCALLAPAEARLHLLALILFNHELARIPEVVTQPMAGMIRLQWWREALDEIAAGRPARQHPVVEALATALAGGRLSTADLLALVDAREAALEPIPPRAAALEDYAHATSGAWQALAYRALGGSDQRAETAARAIGTAFGLVGLAGAVREESRGEAAGATAALRETVRQRAGTLLAEGRDAAGTPPRHQMAAFLPAAFVDVYRRQLAAAGGLSRPAIMPLRLALRTLLRRP